ncbi:50S ribosomal protein L18 [Candidatus Falkowbacteria bacterium]|nr:50S ribosomal protein L18 [Candidatus Falkowbacteria bacterium]
MNQTKENQRKRARRHLKIRSVIEGTAARPRLSVFRSNSSMFLQLIDDQTGKTLISANATEVKKEKETGKVGVSLSLGKLLAEKAKKAGIETVVFDRGGYKYHGRVKAAAEGAREGGLVF